MASLAVYLLISSPESIEFNYATKIAIGQAVIEKAWP